MELLHFYAFRWTLYVVEILIAAIPFFLRKNRRDHFYLRLVLGFLSLGLCLLGTSFLQDTIFASAHYDDSVQVTLSIILYISYFFLLCLFMFAIFKEKWGAVFSSLTQAFSVRQIAFCIFILLMTIFGKDHNFLVYGSASFVTFLYYFGIYLAAYTVYFVSMRKVIFRANNALPPRLLWIYVPVVGGLLSINSVAEIFNENDITLYCLLLSIEIIAFLVLFIADYLLRINDELTVENRIVARLLQDQASQFKFSKANAEDLRRKAHDLKHQVRILREGGEEAEKLLSSLEEDIDDFESTIYLDNQVLNIALREKWGYCKKHHIRFSYAGDPSAFAGLSAVDLFTMTGNIFDNAIEATMKLSDKSRRVISVSIYHKSGMSSLRCDNFYEGEITVENGIYHTSKSDRFNHGYGIRSIDMIARKYGGFVDISAKNGIFVLQVTIPDEEEQTA
ncbi:MAG: ATP-binding protein [Candidatus Enteromonas sp.]|nr:ATP-binding protein [Candidatus Enteromonas sp.]